MPKIHLLDDLTANQIAAGEVIERPVSAVKELVENALDAGARNISVEIRNGGLSLIRVIDDGEGMSESDVLLALKRHATSKIINISDLEFLSTLGFRGEALPSIVSVAKVEIITREAGSSHGNRVYVEGNKLLAAEPVGCAKGTTITVQDLFYNTPARRKFLRSEGYEAGLVHELLIQFALGHPQVSFRLKHQDKEILNTTGINRVPDLIELFYGSDFKDSLVEINGQVSSGSVFGYLTLPTIHRANRKAVHFFVNKRKVIAGELTKALELAYANLLPAGRFPMAVLNIWIPAQLLDVNVHPGKMEIRIRDQEFSQELGSFLNRQIRMKGEIPNFVGIIPNEDAKKTQDACENARIHFPRNKPLSVQETFQEFYSWGKDIKPQEMGSEVEAPISEKYDDVTNPGINEEHAAEASSGPQITDKETSPETSEVIQNMTAFPKLQVIGQLKATFILAEGEEGLYILDQHVAHERVIYDRLMREARDGRLASQVLLTSETLILNVLEEEILLENILALTDLGLILEHFGPRTYLLRAVPACFAGEPREFFYEVLQELENKSKRLSRAELKKDFLIITSCKSAIKANHKLTIEAMNQLIMDLSGTENPFTCPHGRPIIYKVTHNQLLKAFRRI